jgi:hypothetical protein
VVLLDSPLDVSTIVLPRQHPGDSSGSTSTSTSTGKEQVVSLVNLMPTNDGSGRD